jgi:hypothetical protein
MDLFLLVRGLGLRCPPDSACRHAGEEGEWREECAV